MIEMNLAQLFITADYGLQGPFRLALGGDATLGALEVERVLRYLPGKRLACKARKEGVLLFAKLFNTETGSESCQRELRGQALLKANNIKTPALLESRVLPQGHLICYEFLEGSAFAGNIQSAFELIATLHKANLIHNDLHADNLLESNNQLYLLDAGAVEKTNSEKQKIENLALFIAQFTLDKHKALASQKEYYEKIIGKNISEADLLKQVRGCWRKRKNDYLKKIFRSCSDIKKWTRPLSKGQHLNITCERRFVTPALTNLLEGIQGLPEKAEFLKKGESSLVMFFELDGRKLVIKNSRNKTQWKTIRRRLRHSRANNAWRFSHLLSLCGICTPKPIAFVERKLGPLVLEGWYLSEFVEADTLLDVWHYEEASAEHIAQVKRLFDVMRILNISHGDMKGTNLLASEDKLFVIDYDGMREHCFSVTAQKALEKDKERFLKNWSSERLCKQLLFGGEGLSI